MADFTLEALRDEIVNDPNSLGYKNAPLDWNGDQEIADLINAKNLFIDRVAVPNHEIRSATEEAWYNGLLADKKGWMEWETQGESSWPTTADMKLQLSGRSKAQNGVAGTGTDNDSFWTGGDRAEAAPVMLALIELAGSRAEVLWGEGTTIGLGQIGRAQNLV